MQHGELFCLIYEIVAVNCNKSVAQICKNCMFRNSERLLWVISPKYYFWRSVPECFLVKFTVESYFAARTSDPKITNKNQF